MKSLKILLHTPLLGYLLKRSFKTTASQIKICDIHFPNVVGLAAGFDKNAEFLTELEVFGFGSIETGTVTPLPQNGNDKPRLFRLPADKAIINRMGFNNHGADVIAQRLKQWEKRKSSVVIGVNIGKNKQTSNEDAWKDYETCFLKLHTYADYIVVNVSSPNTPGLRDLQQASSLNKILGNLSTLNKKQNKVKPLFLKLSPDLNRETLDEIIALCISLQLDGVIISNTTISRAALSTDQNTIEKIGNGGLSGRPLTQVSTDLVRYVHNKAGTQLKIIASGGIFTTEDAKEKLDAGASLIQIWTGFIYEGPYIVKRIVSGLRAK